MIYYLQAFSMGAIVAVVSKEGKNVTKTAVTMLKALNRDNAEAFGIASPTTAKIEKSFNALRGEEVDSPIAIGHVFSKVFVGDEPQPIKLDEMAIVFEGRLYATELESCDPRTFAEKLKQNGKAAIETLVKETKGNFVFVVAEPSRLIVGRDTLGVRPLYYGENKDLAALASERKALWSIGLKVTISFPPGYMALVDKDGFKFKPIKTLAYSKPKRMTMQAATQKLQALLEFSTKERIRGLKEVAVAFSGGLDSSIIAYLAKKLKGNVHLVHISLKNRPETEHAKRAAEELGLPVHVYLYDEESVERTLPNVLWLIEESDLLKTSIGIPVYWAAEKTAKMKIKVMLAGQGADELFGGYKRYVDDYKRYGTGVRKNILNDIIRMHETNFERDFKICDFHNVELRLPFATYHVAKFATGLPLKLTIGSQSNTLRKLVLRRAAEDMKLPQFIVKQPKKAIQHATGISEALKKVAKRKGLPAKEYLEEIFQHASRR